jgi:hypothetical protein
VISFVDGENHKPNTGRGQNCSHTIWMNSFAVKDLKEF